MQENGENKEFFQKYCPHLGARVTVVSGEAGRACLCSHLCHGQNCENSKRNSVSCLRGGSVVDINEK
ncbi:MAG: hypothetical protein IJW21_04945 [Clostridia bacterium]|nr:hypothetical protein [Clostridia bacterium]